MRFDSLRPDRVKLLTRKYPMLRLVCGPRLTHGKTSVKSTRTNAIQIIGHY